MASIASAQAAPKSGCRFYGKAEETAAKILEAFQSGNLPKALAPVFIKRDDDAPCRKWSWPNQLLTALAGFDDARGFQQWKGVGRSVRKGEKAFCILAPCTRKFEATDKESGETVERVAVTGFRSACVFGYEQTDGEPLKGRQESQRFIDSLPLVDVAKQWALAVGTYNASNGGPLGTYRRGQSIALGVENISTWLHELLHCADDRLGNLQERGQHWRSETVAVLGGAILAEAIGRPVDADRGGCWEYVSLYAKDANLEPITACQRVLDRTCKAVALILETADALAKVGAA